MDRASTASDSQWCAPGWFVFCLAKHLTGLPPVVVVDRDGFDCSRDLGADVHLIDRLELAGRRHPHREIAALHLGGLVPDSVLFGRGEEMADSDQDGQQDHPPEPEPQGAGAASFPNETEHLGDL
jgi:hypothetical protein